LEWSIGGHAALTEGQRPATQGTNMADAMSPIRQMRTAEERIRDSALKRLREATADEMAVFADELRREARDAGATERDLRDARG
jgi:hypothetical protein